MNLVFCNISIYIFLAVAEKANLSALIKNKTRELGFDLCGIAKARALTEHKPILISWTEAGMNDKMDYLVRDPEKRLNPSILFPGAKSLVVTGMNYYSENKQKLPGVPVISRYAYGIDYHDAISPRLEKLLTYVKSIVPEAEGKPYADSGPLLEKAWAKEAGLGWQGRHSIMINKAIGSFFFIGILILNVKVDYDHPFSGEFCGECRLCIDSCPTGAINDDRTIDARKCIANLTIENRGPIPEGIIPKLGGRVYGCDRCQEVCSWNKHAKPNNHPEFTINEKIATMSTEQWLALSKVQFAKLFKKSAIGRVKYEQLIRNIRIAVKSGD